MNKPDIKKEFEAFIGKDRYISFLDTVQHSNRETGRLKFKQEKEWEEFSLKQGLYAPTYGDIWDLFQYCYLHSVEFVQDSVPIIYGTKTKVTGKELEYMEQTFPNANRVAYGSCWQEKQKHKEVFFCTECREALAYEQKKPKK